MKNLIKKEFDRINMPQECADEIRKAITTSQPVRKKFHCTLSRILIAATMMLFLLLTVAAVGLQKGWLDDFLGSSNVPEDVKELQLAAQDGEIHITLDRLLADGPFLYLQVSVRTKGDVDAAEAFEGKPSVPESRIWDRLVFTFTEEGNENPLSDRGQNMVGATVLSTNGPIRTGAMTRLDDGNDRNYCSYTMQILLAELPANYEGLNLTLHLYKQRNWTLKANGGYTTAEKETVLIEETLVLTDGYAEIRTMENGRTVKIHSLGVQIQGADFAFKSPDGACLWYKSGVILNDGTQVSFSHGFTAMDYYAENMQWNLCPISHIIEPKSVVAIYVGEMIYPLR